MKMSDTKRLERLKERYLDGGLDRRTFLGLTAAAAAAAGINLRWGGAALAAAKDVRFDGWGGTKQDAMDKYAFKPYAAKTGNNVIQGTFGDESEIITRIKTASPGEFQIINSSGVEFYKRYIDAGLTTKLNEANIPNMANLMTAAIEPFRKMAPDLSCVPYDYGTSGIAYNTKFISEAEAKEKGVKLLFDPKYQGKIGGFQDMVTRVWYAALALGQDPNAISDVDAIWNKMREQRDLVKKYWSSGAEQMDLLSKEEIVVTDAWSGRIAALQSQGAPIGYLDPPGTYASIEDLLVLKGAPMAECEEMINFMLAPEVMIAVSEGIGYPTALDPNKVKVSDKIKALPAYDPTGTLKSLTFADANYWAGHTDEWTKQWDRIARGG
jgi:spermidine/putrescine transport system substrate-binding protein